jgi:hypothetical protein
MEELSFSSLARKGRDIETAPSGEANAAEPVVEAPKAEAAPA